MAAGLGRRDPCAPSARMRPGAASAASGRPASSRGNQRRAFGRRYSGNHGSRVVVQIADDDRDAGLDDAGLLTRDGGDRRAELRLVVRIDRRDRSDHGRDDIRRVEPAPESDLDDGDRPPSDCERSRRRRPWSPRRTSVRRSARRRLVSRVTASRTRARAGVEPIRGDGRAVDRESLFERDQVRRCVTAGAVARRGERVARPSRRPIPCRWCRRCE